VVHLIEENIEGAIEAQNTHYWVGLLRDSKIIRQQLSAFLITDCSELLKIIGAVIKTLKNPKS